MIKKVQLSFILILIILFTLYSCGNPSEFVEKMVPKAENNLGKSVIELLINGQIDSVYNLMESSYKTEDALDALTEISTYLTQKEPKSIELIKFYTSSTHILLSSDSNLVDRKETILKYELEYEDYWILTEICILNIDGKLSISGIHTNSYNEPLEEINQFSIFSGSEVNIVFLLFALIELSLILYVLFIILKTKPKRKWLWFVFSIFGFFKINTVWGTYTISIELFSIQFFGVSLVKPDLLDPYVLSISLPLGAILFLIKNKRKYKDRFPVESTSKN